MVTTICYGQEKKWDSRQEAVKFFLEAMENSEGAEHEIYTNIYLKLIFGADICAFVNKKLSHSANKKVSQF